MIIDIYCPHGNTTTEHLPAEDINDIVCAHNEETDCDCDLNDVDRIEITVEDNGKTYHQLPITADQLEAVVNHDQGEEIVVACGNLIHAIEVIEKGVHKDSGEEYAKEVYNNIPVYVAKNTAWDRVWDDLSWDTIYIELESKEIYIY